MFLFQVRDSLPFQAEDKHSQQPTMLIG